MEATLRYNEKILDHFHHPRHVGVLNPDSANVGSGLVGLEQRGDVVQLQIQVAAKNGIIETATFQAQASVPTTALCSLATEILIGKTLLQAKQITAAALAETLVLPKTKIHCALLVEAAIKKAITDLEEKISSTESRT